MSPANIYRYFASKDDVIVGLAEREVRRGKELLATLQASGDSRGELAGIIDRYVVSATRDASILRLEIWSEITRNRRFCELAREQEERLSTWLTGLFKQLATSPLCDIGGLCHLTTQILRGIVVSHALGSELDPARSVTRLLDLIDASLAGRLAPVHPRTERDMSPPVSNDVELEWAPWAGRIEL